MNLASGDCLPGVKRGAQFMKLLIVFLLWCGLFVLSWPVAILALVAFPIVWVLCLPFRLLGMTVGAVFSLLKAVLFLPARILGERPRRA